MMTWEATILCSEDGCTNYVCSTSHATTMKARQEAQDRALAQGWKSRYLTAPPGVEHYCPTCVERKESGR